MPETFHYIFGIFESQKIVIFRSNFVKICPAGIEMQQTLRTTRRNNFIDSDYQEF